VESAPRDEPVELVFDACCERTKIGFQAVVRKVLVLLPLQLLQQQVRHGGQKDERLHLVDHARDLPETDKRNHCRIFLIRSAGFPGRIRG
jgi:hypothetical protein